MHIEWREYISGPAKKSEETGETPREFLSEGEKRGEEGGRKPREEQQSTIILALHVGLSLLMPVPKVMPVSHPIRIQQHWPIRGGCLVIQSTAELPH